MNSELTAYIMCGGLSTRMHEEKGLVSFNGKPFIAHIINAVLPITNRILLVTKNENYRIFGYPLVSDVYENKGPVGGIYSALKHSVTDYNLILSCDIPNISTSVIKQYLIASNYKNEVTFLKDDSNDYPLIGIYSKKVTPKFKGAIISNKLKLLQLIYELDFKAIQIDPKDKNAIKNVNSKADLNALNSIKNSTT